MSQSLILIVAGGCFAVANIICGIYVTNPVLELIILIAIGSFAVVGFWLGAYLINRKKI